jgi:hypothetical protein
LFVITSACSSVESLKSFSNMSLTRILVNHITSICLCQCFGFRL